MTEFKVVYKHMEVSEEEAVSESHGLPHHCATPPIRNWTLIERLHNPSCSYTMMSTLFVIEVASGKHKFYSRWACKDMFVHHDIVLPPLEAAVYLTLLQVLIKHDEIGFISVSFCLAQSQDRWFRGKCTASYRINLTLSVFHSIRQIYRLLKKSLMSLLLD